MSTITERVAERIPGRAGGGPAAGPAVRLPTGPRDRRALVAVASLVLVCASVATFAGLYASAGHRTAAVVVVRPLAQGQPITSADLGQADVSVSGGVQYIPVSEASVIEGKRAAAAIPVGSLLTTGDLATAAAVASGDAVVGVALKDGQFPASGLVPGQQVMVVQTGTPGSPLSAPTTASDGSSTTSSSSTSSSSSSTASVGSSAFTGSGTGILVSPATVVSVAQPGSDASGSYTLLVSVEVTSSVAPDVATASSADQVSLVLLGPVGHGGSGQS